MTVFQRQISLGFKTQCGLGLHDWDDEIIVHYITAATLPKPGRKWAYGPLTVIGNN